VARVHLTYANDEVVVWVDDDGKADPNDAAVPGVGLIGMRERVAALGGRLDAGPKDGGGFRVFSLRRSPSV
jgi:signal transduction histidine kinase